MIRRLSAALAGLLLTLAGLFAVTTPSQARIVPSATTTGSSVNNFWIHCTQSGTSRTVDPIVAPGSTSTMHFHSFYGNTSIDQNSTPASLQANNSTTCTTSTDTAGYWAPTLMLGPNEVQTYGPTAGCTTYCSYTNIRAYYSLAGATKSQLVVPPFGEEVVGGSDAVTGPQSINQIGWACGGSTPFEQYPYDCSKFINTSGNADQDGVVMRVIMPRCWNGLDPTNRANFTYPMNGQGPSCPTAFPKVLPLINVRFHTGIVDPCGIGVSCPQGAVNKPDFGFEYADGTMMPWYMAHADFMNGWQSGDGGLNDLVIDCLKLAMACPFNPHTSPKSNMPT